MSCAPRAFSFDQIPRYLLRDRDGIFGGEFRKDVKAMGIAVDSGNRTLVVWSQQLNGNWDLLATRFDPAGQD